MLTLKKTHLSNTNKDRGKTHYAMTLKHKTFLRQGASPMLLRECTHTGINHSIKGTGDRKLHKLYSTLLHFNTISIFILPATYFQSTMPQQPEIPLVLLMDTSKVKVIIPFSGALGALSTAQLPVPSLPPLPREHHCPVCTRVTPTNCSTRPSNYSSILDWQLCYRY